ncbi:putative PEP-binding protein [Rarobacter incanus]|uniref:Phosphoenolpyruvate-protein phosphotransferase n=1 Tax=Rarobacter incanus TaxID=153494 RepID=A0A542SS70_9MICO|nr:putative PEP-binding protein [Rarobacter incanus]TQK77117.1 phosphotransferase system enzyme I (PtsI) [Rarobacter incanus]
MRDSTDLGPRIWRGVGVGRAGAVGPVVQVRGVPRVAPDTPVLVEGIPAGKWALRNLVSDAFAVVTRRLHERAGRATENARLAFESAAVLAEDRALQAEVLARIADGDPAVAAIDTVIAGFASYLAASGEPTAVHDVELRKVRDCVVAEILGLPQPGVPELVEPTVLVARELSTTDISSLNKDLVLAIVTELGGPTSHAAILAGQIDVPCIVQATGVTELADGVVVAVDTATGTVTLDPTDTDRDRLERRRSSIRALDNERGPGVTRDGVAVALEANIASMADAARLADSSVQGVGLYRTEAVFLERATPPGVDEQRVIYERVLRSLGGRPVTIRTVDGGADRPLEFLLGQGMDPATAFEALGLRGFRLDVRYPQILDSQLRAIAAAQDNTGVAVRVMAPMISTPREAAEFAKRAREFGIAQVGAMVEIPSAALRASKILEHVDFISVGTNDLAQYTMAADRTLGELSRLLDPWQPAVLDLVSMAARAGKEHSKPVAVCGEAAADPALALVLVGLGVTSLSMAPGAVSAVRHAIRHHSAKETRAIARAALAESSPSSAKRAALELVDPQVRADLEL